MVVRHGSTDCRHLSPAYFRVFQMSAIPREFGLQLWKCLTNFDMLFLVMGFISLVDEIQFMLIRSRHICIRPIVQVPARGISKQNARSLKSLIFWVELQLNLEWTQKWTTYDYQTWQTHEMRKSLWAIFLDCADWLSRQTWIIWKLWNEMHGTNNLQQLVSHSFETTASLQTSLKLESKSTLWNDHGNNISRCLFFWTCQHPFRKLCHVLLIGQS